MVSNNRYSPRYLNSANVEGKAMATPKGTGMSGVTGYSTEVVRVGKQVRTQIYIDIEGIVSKNTADDVIGVNDAANAHIGQIRLLESGRLVSGTMTCLEAPTGGDNDINLSTSTAGTGAEDAAVTGLAGYAQLLNSGDWTLGLSQALTALPAADTYLYLSAGAGDLAAAYTAGKFLIEFVGYEA